VGSVDVVVVGTGVVGMAIALSAADAGLKVGLVGPGYAVPGAASQAAGAMLGVLGEHTAGQSSTADLWFRHQSALRWPGWLGTLIERAGMRVALRQGTVVIANLDYPADHENLDAIRAAAANLDQPVEELDPRQVMGLRPAARHAPVAALLCPQEGWVDTTALLSAMNTATQTHPRIERLDGTAAQVLVTNGRAVGITLEDGTQLHAGAVILAADTATDGLLAPLAAHTGPLPKVLAAKGVSLLLDVPEPAQPPMVVRTPNRDFACGLHLVPNSGGLYLGATNRFTDPTTTDMPTGATAGEHHHLLHALLHQFRTDLRTAPLIGARWGYRPATSDGAPLIGATALPGLHLATGTYRNGILMAPAIATLITAELLGQPAPLPNPYPPTQRPNRPDIPSLLATGGAQMISVLTDPHGNMPYDRDHQLANTLSSLLILAISSHTDNNDHHDLRERLHAIIDQHPTLEGVCRIFDTWETRT